MMTVPMRTLTMPARRRRGIGPLLAALPMLLSLPASAQEQVAAMVDDSPSAAQRFDQLRSQQEGNPAEAVRLVAELLDDFGDRLVPVEDADGERFRSVRTAVESVLRGDPRLAERHRIAERAVAERLLAEGRLEEVAKRRLWTDAGLEAGLRLAQREAEVGQGHAALRMLGRLAGHPGWDEADAARAAAIAALARWSLGETHDRSLVGIAEEPPPAVAAATPLDAADASPRGADAWRSLWLEEMPQSVHRRVTEGAAAGPRLAPRTGSRLAEDGTLLVTMPAADDRTVYLHEGHRVRAIDRLSRRLRWETTLGFAGGDAGGTVGDPSVAVVLDGSLVAVAGHALGTIRSGAGSIHCLDARDGSTRWVASLADAVAGRVGDAGQGSEAIFPYGVPAIDGRSVHVLARRVSNRLETIDYLVSLSLEDGSLRWVVRLGSSGGIRLGGLRHYSSPLLHEGRVLVASSVGVIAAIDASDGTIEWLRRFAVPLRESPYPVAPWECGAPVAIGEALFAIAPDQSELLKLSIEDGTLLAAAPTDLATLRSPRYLLAAESEGETLLLAAGGDLVAVDPGDLSPRWSFADANEPAAVRGAWPGRANRSGIRGRVQVAGEFALVPGVASLATVRLADGLVESMVPAEEPGNPLWSGGQLLVATKDALAMRMDPDLARERLQDRRRLAPDEAEWPLALLDLELAVGRTGEAVRFAREALLAVEASGRSEDRGALFDRLLEIDRRCGIGDPSETAVRDLLLATAVEPSQQLRERLNRGDWLLSRGRPEEAIEAWRSILAEPEVASAELREADRRMDGRVAAMARLADAWRDGGAAKGAMERSAAASLAAVPATSRDAESMLRFARTHPFTRAAAEASRTAAAALRAAGDPRAGLWVLLEAMRQGGGEDAALVEALAELAIAESWPAAAAAAIAEAGAAVPESLQAAADEDPWRRGWIAEGFEGARMGEAPGEASMLEGRVVRAEGGRLGRRPDRFLLASEAALSMWAATEDGLSRRWSLPIEDPRSRVLWSGRDLLLWQVLDGASPIASRIDAEEGRVRWIHPSLAELLPPPAMLSVEAEVRSLPGEDGVVRLDELQPAVVEDRLVVVRRNGDLVALSMDDGRSVAWRTEGVLATVTHLDAGPMGVLLGGRDRDEEGRLVPAVAWVDADGAVRRRWLVPESVGGIRWVRLSPLGRIAWGSDAGVEVRQVGVGGADLSWSAETLPLRTSTEGWLLPDRLLVRDGPQQLVACRLLDGAAIGEVPAERRDASPVLFVGLRADRGGVTAAYSDRVVRIDADGMLAGIDAVSEDRNYIAFDSTGRGVAVVSSRGTRPAIDDRGVPRTEFAYLVYRFADAEGCRQIGPALEVRTLGPRIDSIACVDGWMLLSSSASTIAIPMSP